MIKAHVDDVEAVTVEKMYMYFKYSTKSNRVNLGTDTFIIRDTVSRIVKGITKNVVTYNF